MGLADKSMSAEDVVSWFGYCMSSCFEYLEYYRSQRKTWLLPLQKQVRSSYVLITSESSLIPEVWSFCGIRLKISPG